MGRGTLVFSLVFLVLPLVGLALAVALEVSPIALAVVSLFLLVLGFTVWLPFVDVD